MEENNTFFDEPEEDDSDEDVEEKYSNQHQNVEGYEDNYEYTTDTEKRHKEDQTTHNNDDYDDAQDDDRIHNEHNNEDDLEIEEVLESPQVIAELVAKASELKDKENVFYKDAGNGNVWRKGMSYL